MPIGNTCYQKFVAEEVTIKRLLLGMLLLLSTQMGQAFAEEIDQIEVEAISAENTLSLPTASNILSFLLVASAKSRRRKIFFHLLEKRSFLQTLTYSLMESRILQPLYP